MSNSEEMPPELDFEAQMLELSTAYERQQTESKLSASLMQQLREISDSQSELKTALRSLIGQNEKHSEVMGKLNASEQQSATFGKALTALTDELKKKNALESSNEKLFAAMHQELRTYKDGFLFDALQKPIVQDLIHLLDDLELLSMPLEEAVESITGGANEKLAPVSNNLLNSIHFLVEILNRLDVEQLVEVETYDKRIHRAIEVQPTDDAAEDGKIIRVQRAGYRWRERILRPVDVVIRRFTKPEPASPESTPDEPSEQDSSSTPISHHE